MPGAPCVIKELLVSAGAWPTSLLLGAVDGQLGRVIAVYGKSLLSTNWPGRGHRRSSS